MKRAHAGLFGELGEQRRAFRVLDPAAGFRDGAAVLLAQGWLVRPAAPAGTESGALGILAGRVKRDVLLTPKLTQTP
jgi:hypothetical protein